MRTWPPSTNGAWYSSDSAQQMRSARNAGTVTAIVPPGRSTRTSSPMAAASSEMCSNTSAAMIRSKLASGNGSAVASPCAQALRAPSPRSPAASMALAMAATSLSSASS